MIFLFPLVSDNSPSLPTLFLPFPRIGTAPHARSDVLPLARRQFASHWAHFTLLLFRCFRLPLVFQCRESPRPFWVASPDRCLFSDFQRGREFPPRFSSNTSRTAPFFWFAAFVRSSGPLSLQRPTVHLAFLTDGITPHTIG